MLWRWWPSSLSCHPLTSSIPIFNPGHAKHPRPGTLPASRVIDRFYVTNIQHLVVWRRRNRHKAEVVANHIVELVLPWCLLLSRSPRCFAGLIQVRTMVVARRRCFAAVVWLLLDFA